MFENRVLRRIFASKRDDVTREWRILHNEELNDLYNSPNIFSGDKIEKNEMGGVCSAIGEPNQRPTDLQHSTLTTVPPRSPGRGVYGVLVRKPEGKRQHRRRWEDNIKMDLQELDLGVWTGSSWLRIGKGGGHMGMR